MERKKKPKVMWLTLMHGRTDPSVDMQGHGKVGPEIGPLTCVHGTYVNSIKLNFAEGISDAKIRSFGLDPRYPEISFFEDMLLNQGVYYGDYYITPNKVGE